MGDTPDDENPLRNLIGFVDEDEFEEVRLAANEFRVEMRGYENKRPATSPEELKKRLLEEAENNGSA